MNQGDLRTWLWRMMATSLRRRAKILTTGDIALNAKQNDVTKARALMEAEAAKYDLKLNPRRRTVEPKTGQPVTGKGPHDLPEERDRPREGEPPAPAGEHKP